MSEPLPVRLRRLPEADRTVPLPAYRSEGAAGMDVAANLAPAQRRGGFVLAPGDRALIPTGFAVALPPGYELQMRPRSGLALKDGVTLLNSPGTIDCDYRGEVGVILINHSTSPFTVSHGMRIAQMVLAPVESALWQETESLDDTARGAEGFGSTGTS